MKPLDQDRLEDGYSEEMNRNPANTAYEKWHREMARAENGDEVLYPWHRTVLKVLPDLNGKHVLEIGCGRGDFTITMPDVIRWRDSRRLIFPRLPSKWQTQSSAELVSPSSSWSMMPSVWAWVATRTIILFRVNALNMCLIQTRWRQK